MERGERKSTCRDWTLVSDILVATNPSRGAKQEQQLEYRRMSWNKLGQ